MSDILNKFRNPSTPIIEKEIKIRIAKPNLTIALDPSINRELFMKKIRESKRKLTASTSPILRGSPVAAEEPSGVPIAEEPTGVPLPSPVAAEEPVPDILPSPVAAEEPVPDILPSPVAAEEPSRPLPKVTEPKEIVKIKVKRRPKAKPAESGIILGSEPIEDRRILSDEVKIVSPTYYMNNREVFNNFMMSLYEPYKMELIDSAEKGQSCDIADEGDFSIATHQKIVRDYINLHTPYRGLLLYHGLGSGKTCSSISIAEGMKHGKRVIVMTPASLQKNYYEELKKCGDILYRKNQYWEFIISDASNIDMLASRMSIDKEYIREGGGVWLVDRRKEPNYNSLSSADKRSLDSQIDVMIKSKYKFINYNGLTTSRYSALTKGGTINPFDNAVIIIDESHNLISRIVNKIESKKETVSVGIYKHLMGADNSKIILLTGTPMLNYPNELGIMFNILRGYIKTWSIKVNPPKKGSKTIDRSFFTALLNSKTKGGHVTDYIDYNPSSTILTITRNPFGFTNVTSKGVYKGVTDSTGTGNITDAEFEKNIIRLLATEKIKVNSSDITINLNTSLPDKLKEFNKLFIKQETGEFNNPVMFTRRILGLTSYFRSASEELLPRYMKSTNYHVIRIEMSDHQFKLYESVRSHERKIDRNNSKKKAKGGNADIYGEMSSTYRIYSRAYCNFVFPEPYILRPKPVDIDAESAEDSPQHNSAFKSIVAIENIDFIPEDNYGDPDDIEMFEKDKGIQSIKENYNTRIDSAMTELESKRDEYLAYDKLADYSPKMLRLFENIQKEDMIGLHLLYSQFRTLEGIGIFKLVLETNGFTQFKIKRTIRGWEIDIPPEDMDKPKFALYTGVEDPEEKEIIRNIFNGTWKYVPASIVTELVKMNDNNLYGEIIKLLMITASGAEGINLFNVRHVHIMEPYWHHARIDQVIGRARRICSHKELPDEHRTVDAYIYLMTLSDKQLKSEDSIELRMRDVSRLSSSVPVTTDENIFELSVMKDEISSRLLNAVKQSSMDCQLHSITDDGSSEDLKCFSFGTMDTDTYSNVPDIENEELDSVTSTYMKTTQIEAVELKDPSDGKKYALDPKTNKIYDYESFHKKRPVQIGILVQTIVQGKPQYKIELI